MDIYSLRSGWATKYIWLELVGSLHENDDPCTMIKNNNITFKIMNGKQDADCIGNDIAVDFYSDKFITILEENEVDNFDKYLINIDDTRYELKNKYYYIESKDGIPRIENEDIYTKPDIDDYCKRNNIKKDDILAICEGAPFYLYGDFSKWDGSNMFCPVDTSLILVTDKMKRILEKMKLKNIEYHIISKYE